MDLLAGFKEKAKANKRRIVLPEGTEIRTLKGAAIAAAEGLAGLEAVVASVGSDGTDGPTDAAGGITDGTTADALAALGISIDKTLADNDAYHALKACGGLIVTGPTGTNVNDITVLLV